MKRKIKGFTLIELLVAIVIFGLLFMIATPQMSNIRKKNEKKKYETYKEALESAAKTYTDSYKKDMFGDQRNGCYVLDYDEMKKHNLINNYQEKNIKCYDQNRTIDGEPDGKPETLFYVYKHPHGYEYVSRVVCRDENGNEVFREDNIEDRECDNEEDGDPPTIEIESENLNEWINPTKETLNIAIIVSDDVGLIKNQKIKYAFKEKKQKEKDLTWHTQEWDNEGGYDDTELTYAIPSEHIPTTSGRYKLIVKPINIKDTNENQLKKDQQAEEFLIDVDAPEIPNTAVSVNKDNEVLYAPKDGSITDWSNWDDEEEELTEFNTNGAWSSAYPVTWNNFDATDNENESGLKKIEISEGCSGSATETLEDTDENEVISTYSKVLNEASFNKTYCVRAVDEADNASGWGKYIFKRVVVVKGCTDSTAKNYNPKATENDGTCKYDIRGCTDTKATNYDKKATVNDGSCKYPPRGKIVGCTDKKATNYNKKATVSNNSCKYIECKGTKAHNYKMYRKGQKETRDNISKKASCDIGKSKKCGNVAGKQYGHKQTRVCKENKKKKGTGKWTKWKNVSKKKDAFKNCTKKVTCPASYKIENANADNVLADQDKHSIAEGAYTCGKNSDTCGDKAIKACSDKKYKYLYDRLIVRLKKTKDPNKVHIKVIVHNNASDATQDGNNDKVVCIMKNGSDDCDKVLGWYLPYKSKKSKKSPPGPKKWNSNKCANISIYDKDFDVSGLTKGKSYKICSKGKGKELRFKDHCTKIAFKTNK